MIDPTIINNLPAPNPWAPWAPVAGAAVGFFGLVLPQRLAERTARRDGAAPARSTCRRD
jgi:hypothetical protein